MELFLLNLTLALSIILLSLLWLLHKPKVPNPPGPRGLPIIGSLHEFYNSIPHYYLWSLSQKYGPLMTIKLGFRQALVVSSAKMAKEVLNTQDHVFCTRASFLGMQKLSYNRLDLGFAPYGDYWRDMRKILTIHFFSSKKVDRFTSVREEEVSKMIQKISKLCASSEVVNLSKLAINLGSSIVCRVAFGKIYDEEEREKRRLDELSKELQIAAGEFYLSDFLPLMGWADKLRGVLDRLEKIYRDLDVFYDEHIYEHLDPQRPKQDHEDILDVLLSLEKDHSLPFEINHNHIKGLLMNVFIGASDTNAAVVVWTMTLLMKNPRVMNKVQEEIRKLNPENNFVKESDLEKLPYLMFVMKESMRLFPPAPLLVPRETMTSCQINGYHIPQGTLTFVNAYAVGRDPQVWQSPEEFYPERFSERSISFDGYDFEFIPFGGGRRICPGIYMGSLTSRLALANLLYLFDWEMPQGMNKENIDFDAVPGVTVHKKNHLCLMAKNYNVVGR